jgi:hypothetical protein
MLLKSNGYGIREGGRGFKENDYCVDGVEE